MSKMRADCRAKRRGRARTGALPNDLYAYAEAKPLPASGVRRSTIQDMGLHR
ncbi:hypothetical protein [Devosia faecipullorum]|jgi:hypothetical protein|uniref:hypothetical protein n=1 Tax=Devosia faecipullorum TaxID=2755039 RepID=UPI00187B836A|nr:hypothetical protein [Devosia faecipullorum]MBE7734149.1 hypothetical protein [Devosia faecipullorum]